MNNKHHWYNFTAALGILEWDDFKDTSACHYLQSYICHIEWHSFPSTSFKRLILQKALQSCDALRIDVTDITKSYLIWASYQCTLCALELRENVVWWPHDLATTGSYICIFASIFVNFSFPVFYRCIDTKYESSEHSKLQTESFCEPVAKIQDSFLCQYLFHFQD